MNKKLFTTIVGVFLTVTITVSSHAENPVPHRLIHGFFLNGDNLNGFGFGHFYMDNLNNLTLSYPYQQPLGIYGGACVENVYYACEYTYNSYGSPTAGDFISYNMETGKKKIIGKYANDNDQFRIQGMTYDYNSETLYAVGYENGESSLYTFDKEKGTRQKVVTLSEKGVGTLAADLDGKLYTIGQNGMLYRIDKTSGELTSVCETDYKGMISNQTMEFDHTTGLLYWASLTYSKDGGTNIYLLQFDLKKSPVEVKEIGKLGENACLLAMYIPFVKAGEGAPAAPSDVSIEPDKTGKNNAKITWKNPTKTFGGDDLSNLKSITIKRNGTIIANIPATGVGEIMNYEDNEIGNNGEYKYTIYATNQIGDGEEINIPTSDTTCPTYQQTSMLP